VSDIITLYLYANLAREAQEFAAFIREDTERWAHAIRAAGVRLD
jgi:hypothetical protein